MVSVSRVKKFKELRENIRGEAGINREEPIVSYEKETEDDEFLSFIKKEEIKKVQAVVNIDDTITEAKTFQQLSRESNEEIDKALRNVKSSVGKEEYHNTRMDILNRIRYPKKEVIKVDTLGNINTEQFAKGYFVKEVEEDTIETNAEAKVEEPILSKAEKKKMTLMERLGTMSPKEDVEHVEKVLQQEKEELEEVEEEQTETIEEQVLAVEETVECKRETVVELEDVLDSEQQIRNKDELFVVILNYAIIALLIIFMVICGMIVYQVFF